MRPNLRNSGYLLPPRIDNELRRENTHETERKWTEQQEKWARMEPHIPNCYIIEDETVEGFIADGENSINFMRRKDEMMAADDPMRYCADRCVTTGNCDVFEVSLIPSRLRQPDESDLLCNLLRAQDMFDMDPKEVMSFCTDCVLSEDEEPCDVPGTLFDDMAGLSP